MKYYIKERISPQFDKPYYSMMGKLSQKNAKKHEKPIYGTNNMIDFDTEDEYLKYAEDLRNNGYSVAN